MKKHLVGPTVLLILVVLGSAIAQSINASLSGTVQDSTQAVIVGATVTATNTETGVVSTAKVNESGVYNFASLQPGKSYTVSAELIGFRTKVYKDLELGSAQQVRQNFVLQVGETAATNVDVSVAADSLLATSGASIGNVLAGSKVRELPLVGNNVLDLINIMSGYTQPNVLNNSASAASATLAGLPIMSVNTTMDGISVQDNRYDLGVSSATHINPDLVEEIRLIVAPVDAETGRGSGQVKILTRSGTNKFNGSAFWNVQNSALNANTYNNNRTGVKPNWYNQQQYSVSYGGPIVRNKTFFFVLYEGQTMNSRSLQSATVLTAEARKGNFRFFPGIANGNADQVDSCTAATPIARVVDVLGNPLDHPACTTGTLQTISVFGRDPNRPGMDPTGYVQRVIDSMPLPNYFGMGSGDGLNQAQFRWIKRGDSIIGGQQGLESDVNRKQINIKIDENLNSRNKLTVGFSDERRHSTTSPSVYPGGWTPSTKRTPRVITVSYTSTLSSSMVNEFRFGFQRTKSATYYPYDDPATKDAVLAYLPNVNGIPIIGAPLTYSSNLLNPGLNTNVNNGPLYSYADTLSWSKGKHAYKGGFEFRAVRAEGFNSLNGIPHVTGGAGNVPVQGFTTALGLAGSSTAGTIAGAQNLLLSLNGSLSTVSQAFILQDAKQTSRYLSYADPNGYYKDREYDHNEESAFFKDDWKIRPSLTLNLGVRWEHYGVPWEKNGLMASVVHGGLVGGFGYTGAGFADWGNYGPQKGDLTTVQFVGVNSTHPKEKLYKDDWNNFGPNVGFSWTLPWLGEDKTTLRGGYGISFQTGVTPFDLDTNVSMMPGINDAQAVNLSGFTNLANLVIPSAVVNTPLQPIPLNQRNQTIAPYDTNYVTPYIQNFNVSLTRNVLPYLTVDVRWVGTRGVKLFGSVNLNQVNYINNGLLDALNVTRAGGDAPLFNQMMQGLTLNPCPGGICTPTSPSLGQGVVNGTTLTGSAAIRANATYKSNIANGNFAAVASSLNTSTFISSLGAGGLLQNGGLPPNFITNNPQFLNVNLQTNPNNSIYHSLQSQVTLRPTQGTNLQATYSFQRGIASNSAGGTTTWLNVLDRDLDRSLQSSSRKHDFRLNGTFELPVGPNKLLLSNSRGALARLVEKWDVSVILNLLSGSPLDITGTNTYIGGGQPDVVGSLAALKDGHTTMTSPLPTWFPAGTFTLLKDPQCNSVTNLQTTQSACSNNALADAANNLLVVNSQPGKLGNLGPGAIYGPGTIGFDASASKTVRIRESNSVQIRVDAKNVLNHPLMGNPNLNINNTNFGQITTVTGSRTFQGTFHFSTGGVIFPHTRNNRVPLLRTLYLFPTPQSCPSQ